MPVTPLPFAEGFYQSASLPVSAQQCVNLYPVIESGPALSPQTLRATPGVSQLATSGAVKQINRGAHVMAGVPYFVNGQKLYKLTRTVDGDGVETFALADLGAIEGTGRVSMADNGTQLMVLVPGGKGYIYNGSTLAEITDLDFTANGNPQVCFFVDGYFACTTDSKKWIVSATNDGTSWNALDFGSAEADPDDIVGGIVYKNQVFIAGAQTFEAQENIGGADFPFQRNGLYLDKGVAARDTLIKTSNGFMWIGAGENETPAVWEYTGGSPEKRSTRPIDELLNGFTTEELSTAFAWSYAQNGAYFVGFALPTTTLVYDLASGKWHERTSRITSPTGSVSTVRWRANSVVQAYGRIIVGDSQDGRVGCLSEDTFGEYGTDIRRFFVPPHITNNGRAFFMPSLELTVETGVGNSAVTDPLARLEVSRDFGATWGNERPRSMGKIGDRKRRTIWRRNGRFARAATLRITMSDQVKTVVAGLTAQVEAGT